MLSLTRRFTLRRLIWFCNGLVYRRCRNNPDQMPCYVASEIGLHCLPMSHKRTIGLYWLSSPVRIFLLTLPRRCFFCRSFLLFMSRVCHAFLSVHCSLVVTCSDMANLLAVLCVMFYCVVVTFPCGVLGQVW